MTDRGQTPPTRKQRRAQERANRHAPIATAAPTPAWRSPVALISLGALVVGIVIVGVLALGTLNQSAAPLRTPPSTIADALVDGRSLGPVDAPVQIEAWADPQCPVCGRFTREIEPLLVASYVKDGTVRLNYRDFVFLGPESLDAATGMRAAEQLDGRFWDYQAMVYENQDGENQGAFARDRLADMAELIGLDRSAFLALLDDEGLRDAVLTETATGQALGINSTPTLIINGVVRPGMPTWDELSAQIEAAAAAASPAPSAASPAPATSATPGASPAPSAGSPAPAPTAAATTSPAP